MAKKDYKAMAAGIIKQAGGADNIVSATHCMTRLRLVLRDRSKFDTDAVKQVPGVLNVIIQNGEYQVVIGQDVPDLYEEVVKIDGIQAGGVAGVHPMEHRAAPLRKPGHSRKSRVTLVLRQMKVAAEAVPLEGGVVGVFDAILIEHRTEHFLRQV